MRELYPPIEPYNEGKLSVSSLHTIHYEQSGNPNGKPVIFLHGGPGGGITPMYRQYFNPEKWRIIIFDQRGCGQSTPYAELRENTTWDLVSDDDLADIEEQEPKKTIASSNETKKIINVYSGDYNDYGGDDIDQYQRKRMTRRQKEKNNAWLNGSFYMLLFVVVMTTFAVIGKSVPAVILPLVIIGGLLAIGIIGAFQLRNDDSLSQKNFLTLILKTYKRLPLLRRNNQKKNRDQ